MAGVRREAQNGMRGLSLITSVCVGSWIPAPELRRASLLHLQLGFWAIEGDGLGCQRGGDEVVFSFPVSQPPSRPSQQAVFLVLPGEKLALRRGSPHVSPVGHGFLTLSGWK